MLNRDKFAIYITVRNLNDAVNHKAIAFLTSVIEEGFSIKSAIPAEDTVHYILVADHPVSQSVFDFYKEQADD